jgi:hypothetical protein
MTPRRLVLLIAAVALGCAAAFLVTFTGPGEAASAEFCQAHPHWASRHPDKCPATTTTSTTTSSSTTTTSTTTQPPTCTLAAPCFDWIGATSAGVNGTAVPNAAHDMAVSSDGYATTGAPWVETSYDQRVFKQDGTPTGPCPFNASGRFRENGGGSGGVEITGSDVYAVQARNLVRWPRTDWLSTTRCDGSSPRGQMLNLGGSGTLLGVSVTGGEAYVTDAEQNVGGASPVSPATAKIKVYNADLSGGLKRQWTVPNARQTTVDRQGNIWVLQQRTSSTPAKLSRYSPQGSLLTSFAVGGEPMDIAASPVADEVWIPDNGIDQDVEAYSYSGTQVDSIGQSYLSGPTPGQIGPQRFAGPRGVDVDGSGNVYVTQTCNPGRGTKGWADDGYCMILSKHQPDGTQVWRVEDDILADMGEPVAGGHTVYTPGLAFNVSGGEWSLEAVTIDPWTYPNDPRASDNNIGFGTAGTAQVRDVNGTRLMLTTQNGFLVRVFKIVGDIAVPVASFPQLGGEKDVALAGNGDVYQTRTTNISRYPYNGTGYGARVDLPMPPGFADVRRLEIDGSRMFVGGFAAGESDAGATNYPLGRHIALFPSLPTSSWPAPTWTKATRWVDGTTDIPLGLAADGSRFAIGFMSDDSIGGPNRGYVRVYRTSDGAELRQLHWPTESGHYDQTRPLAFVDNVVYAEEDFVGKINTADLGP